MTSSSRRVLSLESPPTRGPRHTRAPRAVSSAQRAKAHQNPHGNTSCTLLLIPRCFSLSLPQVLSSYIAYAAKTESHEMVRILMGIREEVLNAVGGLLPPEVSSRPARQIPEEAP